MIESLISNLRTRDALTAPDEDAVRDLFQHENRFRAGEDIVVQGSRPVNSTLLLEGLAARYRLLEDGKRQITVLHIGGDFVDLHAFILKQMDHGVIALTDCHTLAAPHRRLQAVTEENPHLTRMFWLLTLIDGSIHREWITAMGRREIKGHMAHLICEMFYRYRAVDLIEGQTFRFPITQAILADVMGVSTVHVNKTLQILRSDGLLIWKDGRVQIPDLQALETLAEFDPLYLHFQSESR
ncbi:Crp/Fnr family transcriptional regulator [Metarhizobium album]|uniref:Crp/Fnr family transcriptional regulator n=1 Tax=Metarhizobium album TaxID=2182425 RepID=A0A2U2DHK4_9HYPH|nr:Crp/Fnr family transcriptional regulator [Rhizobium album]PWE52803.1 Crp/Fnr family transcriptional regulator [Rhizobium album]